MGGGCIEWWSEGLIKKVTLEQKAQGGEGVGQTIIWMKSVSARKQSMQRSLGQDGWDIPGAPRRPGWLGQRRRENLRYEQRCKRWGRFLYTMVSRSLIAPWLLLQVKGGVTARL